jgi:hypothetical protein
MLGVLPEVCHSAACQLCVQRAHGRFQARITPSTHIPSLVRALRVLPQVPALRSLVLQEPPARPGTHSDRDAQLVLAPMLARCSQLQGVPLELGPDAIVQLLPHLAGLQDLRNVSIFAREPLQGSPFSESSFFSQLESFTQLTHLSLTACPWIDFMPTGMLWAALPKLRQLQSALLCESVRLARPSSYDGMASTAGAALARLTRLTCLELCVDGEALRAVAAHLATLPRLAVCHAGPRVSSASHAVQAQLTRLTQACFGLGLDQSTLEVLTKVPDLTGHKELAVLQVSGTYHYGLDVDVAALGVQIAALTALQRLECSGWPLGVRVKGGVQCATQLATHALITSLRLRRCRLQHSFLHAFGRAASNVQSLVALDLSGNDLIAMHGPSKSAGLGTMFEALPQDAAALSGLHGELHLSPLPSKVAAELAAVAPPRPGPVKRGTRHGQRHQGSSSCSAGATARRAGAPHDARHARGARRRGRSARARGAPDRARAPQAARMGQDGVSGGGGARCGVAEDPRQLTCHGWPRVAAGGGFRGRSRSQ